MQKRAPGGFVRWQRGQAAACTTAVGYAGAIATGMGGCGYAGAATTGPGTAPAGGMFPCTLIATFTGA